MYYCRDKVYCEGTFLVRQDLPTIANYLPMNWPEGDPAPVIPRTCPAGEENGFLFFGPDDWSKDSSGSLHGCGFGDRSEQKGVSAQLPP